MRNIRTIKGEWNLPGNQNILPGKLSINYKKNKITLLFITDKYLNGEEVKTNNFINNNNHNYYIQINGTENQKMTLYSCSYSRFSPIARGQVEISYNVEYVFFNVHLKNVSKLKIKRIDSTFPYLSSIFDGYDSINRDFENQTERTTRSVPIKISKNLDLVLVDKYYKKLTDLESGHQMKFSKSIEFKYQQSETFNQIYRDLRIFSSFLSFNTKKTIDFKLNYIEIPKEEAESYDEFHSILNPQKNDFIHCSVINFTLQKSNDFNKKSIHQSMMYISGFNSSFEELSSVICKWFENNNYRPIYDFYNDSNNWFENKSVILSNVMYNNKFLNLIQGLESYYDLLDLEFIKNNDEFTKNRQQVISSLNNSSLEKWVMKNLKFPKTPNLTEKLENLIYEFKLLNLKFEPINNFIEEYPIQAKEYRNKLSHGRIETTYQGKNFEKLFSFSKILLCFCILKSLKINSLFIERYLRSNYNITRELNKITSL
ncbi:ApeA N-terminal domain 1-containing protein [Flavicella sediminum]|uniref:ApeA N-terminal domain 1-containing protein n=1 Tax=Flavicella sediminum TaxID=2585141 RepID=UPI00111FD734|nr:HEPN domain-containing protein [Flavicella sediminum]